MPKPIPLGLVQVAKLDLVPTPADVVVVLETAAERSRRGMRGAMATVVSRAGSAPATPGQKIYASEDGTCVGTVGGGAIEREVLSSLQAILADAKHPHTTRTFRLGPELGMCCGGSVDVLLEPIVGFTACMLVGGGHVATAVAPILARVGFVVTVVDAREAWGREGRIEGARTVVGDFDDVGEDIPTSGAVLVMTHDHGLDQRVIEWAPRRGFAFVGGVGSRAKAQRTKDRLEAKGFSEADRDRVRMPLGVSIGARLPDEIAVAIAAEMVTWRRVQIAAERPIVGVILAAGDGVRMGGSKALLLFGGEPLPRVHARNFLDAGVSKVLVVVRRRVFEEMAPMPGMELVVSAAEDPAGSLALAVKAAPANAELFLITPVDCVPVGNQTLARLLSFLARGESLAVTPRFQGRGGHPAACRSEALARLQGRFDTATPQWSHSLSAGDAKGMVGGRGPCRHDRPRCPCGCRRRDRRESSLRAVKKVVPGWGRMSSPSPSTRSVDLVAPGNVRPRASDGLFWRRLAYFGGSPRALVVARRYTPPAFWRRGVFSSASAARRLRCEQSED